MGIAPDYVPKGQPPRYINQSECGLNDLQAYQNTLNAVAWVMLIINTLCTLGYAALLVSDTLVRLDVLAVWLLTSLNLITGSTRIYIDYQTGGKFHWVTKIAMLVWIIWFGIASWNLIVQHVTLH